MGMVRVRVQTEAIQLHLFLTDFIRPEYTEQGTV
jgi:hypothetical protein